MTRLLSRAILGAVAKNKEINEQATTMSGIKAAQGRATVSYPRVFRQSQQLNLDRRD